MPHTSFEQIFLTATGEKSFDYQCCLANGTADNATGTDCSSKLISIPTGLGKTAAVVLAWLWNRVVLQREDWPRRLVYCLPMRTLVEQTRNEVGQWIENILSATDAGKISLSTSTVPDPLEQLQWLKKHSPVILMGGEENDPARRDWDIHPERPAILIGTQDMLLSRALNRGYGMARARWPMHFGLLNNDALWVLDETQLMGAGVGTAAQLEAFRNEFKTFPSSMSDARPSATWYLSATSNPAQLQTRDWRGKQRPNDFALTLNDGDKRAEKIAERLNATKTLEIHKDWKIEDCADKIIERHKAGQRTLVIVNTVKRAVAVYEALEAKGKVALLLHSRFRPHERKEQRAALDATIPQSGQLVVATQVVEAGVDISSAVLWTEVAPLAALVQRFGRLNRRGELTDAQCVVVGLGWKKPEGSKEKKAKIEEENAAKCLPYDIAACRASFETLRNLDSVSPAKLEEHQAAIAQSIPLVPYSLQRHELLDFFDTDANLSLGFTDVSPFVRSLDEDTDVHVLWRDALNNDKPPSGAPNFQHDEICAIPISQAKEALSILNRGWFYRGKKAGWASIGNTGIFPGMTIVLPTDAGGYSAELGWTGKRDDKPNDIHQPATAPSDEDLLAFLDNGWQSIAEHTADVDGAFDAILKALPEGTLTGDERGSIKRGIAWHDVGKNHAKWQTAVKAALTKAEIDEGVFNAHLPLAKFSLSDSPQLRRLSDNKLKDEVAKLKNSFHPGVAHEVASALAFRAHELANAAVVRPPESILAEYLIMSHHGHVRKALRDELPRHPKDAKDTDSVRGVADGDTILSVEIETNGQKQQLGCTALSTDCRKMGRDTQGRESYTRGVLRLLDKYGPFRLAYLEALFRAADCRASQKRTAS